MIGVHKWSSFVSHGIGVTRRAVICHLLFWSAREGVLEQGPSLQFMRTAYGAAELDSTTLRSIGLVT